MTTSRSIPTLLLSALLVTSIPALAALAPPTDASAPSNGAASKSQQGAQDRAAKEAARERAKWNLKLDKSDRAECDKGIGFVAPTIPESCEQFQNPVSNSRTLEAIPEPWGQFQNPGSNFRTL